MNSPSALAGSAYLGIRARPGRAALSCLSLVIGILALMSVEIASALAREAILRPAELRSGSAGTWAATTDGSPQAARAASDAARAAGATGTDTALLATDHGATVSVGPGGARLDTVSYAGDVRAIRPFPVLAGSWPDPEAAAARTAHVALNTAAAELVSPDQDLRSLNSRGFLLQGTPGSAPEPVRVLAVVDDGDDLPRAWVPAPEVQARAGAAPQAQLQILARTPTGTGAARDILARATESHAVPLTGAIVRVDTVDDLASTLSMLRGIFFGVGAITLTVGVIGVLNIGLASLRERAEELALRRALGARRSDVAVLVLAESVLIGLLGAAAAIACATGLFHTLAPAVWGSAGTVSFPLSAGFAGLAAGALAGLAGGAVPALRAARLPIATVMRA